jgi:hypothetical protein
MEMEIVPTTVNREGYLVTHSAPGEGPRTYACADLASLSTLILRLTGRELSTYVRRGDGSSWSIPDTQIAYPLHIYSTVTVGAPL